MTAMQWFNVGLSILTTLICMWVVPSMFYYWWWLDPDRFSFLRVFNFQSIFLLGVVIAKTGILLTSISLIAQMLVAGQYPTLWTLPGRIMFLVAVALHLFSDLRIRLPGFMETHNAERGNEK